MTDTSKKQKTLAFFGAHPDDETFGPGSTLAQYALSGVPTYYVCSTGGEEGTVESKYLEDNDSIFSLRKKEMQCAAEALGLAGVYYLGYRDSGMMGSPDNKHPQAMAMAKVEESAGRVVKIIREIKPDVIVTHDAGGGYGHPDHIGTYQAVVKAFHAAADPEQYPEAGPPFKPSKLYFAVRSHRMMRFLIRLMPLFGQDPHHFGRNKDLDLTKTIVVDYPINAIVRVSQEAIEARNRAASCHASQSSGGKRPMIFRIMEWIDKVRGPRDSFMREYPPVNGRRVEKDLFEGID